VTTDPALAADPAGSAASRPGIVRVRLTVAYDGSAFHGMAANRGVTTVAGTLAEALERVLGEAVELSVAGRTDKGVHAHGQVVSFDAPAEGLDLAGTARAVNAICGPEIAVRDAAVVAADFDARFSATWRSYRYTVLNRPDPDPFLARTAWWVPSPLALPSLRLGCDPLIGEHDFSSFCRRPKGAGADVSMVRRVLDARWRDLGDGRLRFDIRANAFCHQMVRSIVGLLVDVGRGRRRAGDVAAIRAAGDRAAVPTIAPPHGLCLGEVGYPG
jgi:tRNA pseudouridine38-40 synthase